MLQVLRSPERTARSVPRAPQSANRQLQSGPNRAVQPGLQDKRNEAPRPRSRAGEGPGALADMADTQSHKPGVIRSTRDYLPTPSPASESPDDPQDARNDPDDIHNDSQEARNDSEDAHDDSEDVRNDSENSRNDSEDSHNDSENSRNDSENSRNDSENSRNDSEDAQHDSDDARQSPVSTIYGDDDSSTVSTTRVRSEEPKSQWTITDGAL
ncbi:unnamed protein product [Spodoptera exigua]|nr:unnamed protein product [Spodoptera exigua]